MLFLPTKRQYAKSETKKDILQLELLRVLPGEGLIGEMSVLGGLAVDGVSEV